MGVDIVFLFVLLSSVGHVLTEGKTFLTNRLPTYVRHNYKWKVKTICLVWHGLILRSADLCGFPPIGKNKYKLEIQRKFSNLG